MTQPFLQIQQSELFCESIQALGYLQNSIMTTVTRGNPRGLVKNKSMTLLMGVGLGETFLLLVLILDCSLPGSSIHRIFQARVLEWVTISFSIKVYKALIRLE